MRTLARKVSAPPVATPDPSRRLRVAVIQGGVIVEERLLPAHASASVGSAPAATFVVAWQPGVRKRHELFVARRGRYSLHLLAGMHARVATGDSIVDYRTDASHDQIVLLPENARGRVVAGEVTLLFQLVRPPPPRPRVQLPASVRGTLWSRVDPWFASIALGSLLLHVVMAVYLRGLDWPRKPDIETVAERWIHDPIVLPMPRPAAPAPEPAVSGRKMPVAKAPPVAKPATPAPSAEERHARITEAVNRQGLIAVLHSLSENGASLPDLLGHGAVDVDQERALAGVGGVQVASADRLRGVGSPDGTGRVVSVSGLRGSAAIAVAIVGPDGPERRASAHVAPEAPVIESGNGDPAAIAREVRSRLAAIRACYERALRRTPSLAGKLVLHFIVAPAGNVQSVTVEEDTLGSAEVATCIRETVARWRFAAGPEPVEVAFPFVFQSSG